MSRYTVRVELHDAEGDEYDELHKEMEKQGFTKTIWVNNTKCDLPTAEYSYIAKGTNSTAVLNKAKVAALKVQPDSTPSIVVTESEKVRMTYGLTPSKK